MRSSTRTLGTLGARPHLVLPCARDRAGLTGPTPAETRGPRWRRASWNRYVPAEAELTVEQRILEAAVLAPPHGGVTGWAARHWLGETRWSSGFDASGSAMPIWLAIGGENIRPQPGIRVSEERLDPCDLIVVDGIRLTSAVRSTCFDMRYAADEREAGRLLSMAAYHDLVSVEEMARYASEHNGWTGIPQCRAGSALAEENCWSPTEFDMVMTWRLDAGLPRPLCNQPVFDRAGAHLGTPDFIDIEAGVVGQYDGGLHLTGRQRGRDVRRDERYRAVGLETVVMTAVDLRDNSAAVQRMLATRGRARFEAEAARAWTVVPPSRWIPTHTVSLRRALAPDDRVVLLQYRRA